MSYGLPVELTFGTPRHAQILNMVIQRRKASQKKMREFYSRWDDADDSFKAYQPASEVDRERKNKRRTEGIHDYTTITVPYTFAIIMTAHTYWSTVFLSRAPIYQLQGRHGEAQDSIEAFEAVLDYQRTVGGHLVPLFNWLFDMSKYGLGINSTYWDRQESSISSMIEEPVKILGIPISNKTRKVMKTEIVVNYEGNCVYNVRPHDFFPDPRVTISDFQRGEFCGRDTTAGWHEILEGERSGKYFNVRQLAAKISESTGSQMEYDTGSPRVNLPDQPGHDGGVDAVPGPGFVRLHEMYVRLIPSVWKLSNVTRTEIWCFTVANESVVIGAQPLGLVHNKFPFDVMEFGFGAHEFVKTNLVEVMQPFVDAISWLMNSHFYNVRKALNDVRVVDPSRVVMKDLTSPIERGIVRLKPEAYGSDVRTAVHQLTVPDMTRSHIADIAVMEQMVQRITGVVDELMGLSTGPSRESATGVRTRTGFAANRLKTIAEYNSGLGFAPFMDKLITNTQQLMSLDEKFRIAGSDGMQNAKRFVQVNRALIAGRYDYVPVDGTLPIDRLAQANFWKELTIQLAQVPQLAMQWNLMEMISHIMRLQGEKNVNRFRLDLSSPDQIQRQVQAGNLVPVEAGATGDGPANISDGTSGAVV